MSIPPGRGSADRASGDGGLPDGAAPSLGPAEQRVAAFFERHPHRVGHLSAARIAAEAGTSDATVVRTARALGYSGLAELREAFAARLAPAARMATTLRATAAGGRPEPLRYVDERADDVGRVARELTGDQLGRAAGLVASAGRVVVAGFGPTAHLCRYAVHQLRRIGRPAVAITTTGRDLADHLLDLGADDVVVLCSYEDRLVAAHAVADRAGAVGAAMVLVTDAADRPLAARAAAVVVAGRGTPAAFASHAATIVVLESLVVGCAAADPDRARESLQLLADLRAVVGA